MVDLIDIWRSNMIENDSLLAWSKGLLSHIPYMVKGFELAYFTITGNMATMWRWWIMRHALIDNIYWLGLIINRPCILDYLEWLSVTWFWHNLISLMRNSSINTILIVRIIAWLTKYDSFIIAMFHHCICIWVAFGWFLDWRDLILK